MSESLRWKLCLGCLLLAALEAPQAALLVLQDLAGPYSASAPANARVVRVPSASVAVVQLPVVDASLFALGLGDLTAQYARSSDRAAYLLESGHDLDSNARRAGWNVPATLER